MSDLLARLRIEATAGNLPAVAGQVERSMDGLRSGADRTGAAMTGAAADANRLAGGLDRAGDQAQRLEGRTRGLRNSVSALGGVLGAVGLTAFIRDATGATFAAGGLEMGLGAVAGGASGATAELAFVRQEATRLGLVVQGASKDFLELAGSTNGTAIAGQATRDIWLATAEAGFALGRSEEQVGRGLTALSQIAAKGVVSMEEVRQQLAEAIPGAAAIGARAMGLSTAAFNDLIESGKLTAEQFLPAFAAQLREEFGPSIEAYLNSPLGQARQIMAATETNIISLKAATGEGFLDGAIGGVGSLADRLGDPATVQNARDLGLALGHAASVAAEGLAWAADNADLLIVAAQALAGIGVARVLVATAAGAREAAAAYVLKAGAARSSALTAQQALAGEAAALTGVRGALVQAAAAEVAAAQAARASALAREMAAKAALDQARADLANVSSSNTLAQRRAALAAAEAELAAARTASAAAAGRVAVAEAGHARSMTVLGQAAGLARGGMSALLNLVGGPWGAAFLAAGAAVWAVSDAISDAQQRAATAKASTDAYAAAMQEAAEWLDEASGGARAFGKESAGAVAGTNLLAGATGGLADQVFRLANARAEERRQRLMAAYDQLGEERDSLKSNGFQDWLRTGLHAADARFGGGLGVATASLFAPTHDSRIAEIDRQRRDLLQRAVDVVVNPTSQTPETTTTDDTTAGPVADTDTKGAKGKSAGRDRSADMMADLQAEALALAAHSQALVQGEAALDAWRVAQAGADAVARAGVDASSAAAQAIRTQAEQTERLAIADERIEEATNLSRAAAQDIAAMQRRAQAALQGREALEALRISEAGLDVLRRARVDSLDQLGPLERQAVETAMADAEARERQALATERAEAAGKTVQQLQEQIDAEMRRAASIGQGVAAEVAYARAAFVRQEVERAGLKVTDEAARAIMEKAEALFRAAAANDNAQGAADAERELRRLRLSNREREIAVRAEALLRQLLSERLDLSEAEAKAQADRRARAELEAEETAAAIGRITGSLRDGFIRDGKLGMDQVGDYAEERLREALYDAWLAKPIEILVNASVNIVNDLAKQIFGGSAAKGFLGDLLGGLGGFGKVLGGAGVGAMLGSAMGLGSGNGLLDLGLGLGGSALGGMLGGAMTSYATTSSLAFLSGSAAGPLAGLAGVLGPIMGPLGALAGLAIGSLFKDEKRPYTRADIVARDGQWVVAGSDAADGGSRQLADQLGAAITASLNAASGLFGIDVKRLEGLYTTAGYVTGGNYKALGGEGFFGGDIRGIIDYFNQAGRDLKGNTLGAGVSFSQVGDAEKLAEQVVRETILRAIAAGASDLSDAEARLVQASTSLEEAIKLIQSARGFTASLDDMLLEFLDPAAFERKKALDAVEASYQALRTQAEELIAAGLLSADALVKIEQLRALKRDKALQDLDVANGGGNPFVEARQRLQSWLDGINASDFAGGPQAQRQAAEEAYRRQYALAWSGDRNALSEITAYADRLFRADRAATGSATARDGLFREVTGDIERLMGRSVVEEPLTPGAISKPIVDALAASETALADVLMTLPAQIAAPILAGLLQRPDWAIRLLGENAQVPPALAELVDQVRDVGPSAAIPIITALLSTPQWAAAMNGHLSSVPMTLEMLQAALTGLPPELAQQITDAVVYSPPWADALAKAVGVDLATAIDGLGAEIRRLLAQLGIKVPGGEIIRDVLPGYVGPDDPGLPPPPPPPGPGPGPGGGEDLPPGWGGGGRDVLDLLDQLQSRAETPVVPMLADLGALVGAGARETTDAIDRMTRAMEGRFEALQRGFEDRMADLHDATVQAADGAHALGAEQVDAIRDLASSQRMTAASRLAKAA